MTCLLTVLFELELSEMIGAVAKSDDENPAGSFPGFFSFPDLAAAKCRDI
jgi:hypothetical protein